MVEVVDERERRRRKREVEVRRHKDYKTDDSSGLSANRLVLAGRSIMSNTAAKHC